MDPGSNVIDVTDVGSVVPRVGAATVDHHGEQLVACVSA